MSSDEETTVTSTDIRLNPEYEARLLGSVRRARAPRERSPELRAGEARAGSCLVIGESGANWAAGIAAAREFGPNLALVTQWVGESPAHFGRRVISRLAKRHAFDAVVLVCSDDSTDECAAARQAIVLACDRALLGHGDRHLLLLCKPNGGGGMPSWAPRVAEKLLAKTSSLVLRVSLADESAA